MREKLSNVRTEINSIKSKLSDLNIAIDSVILKYTSGKLGIKEFNRQTSKLLKDKNELLNEIKLKTEYVEELEKSLEDSKVSVLKVVPDIV